MRVSVITAVSRPQNLPLLAESLARAHCPGLKLNWVWEFDLEKRFVGGQIPKNIALERIEDGWVWMLDDDNLVHPEFFKIALEHADAEAIVVSQIRRDGDTLHAAPENAHPGGIDIAQALLRRSLIGDQRLLSQHDGDGHFLECVLEDARVAWIDEALSYHNALG